MGCGSSSDTATTANNTSDNVSQLEMVTKFGRVSKFKLISIEKLKLMLFIL